MNQPQQPFEREHAARIVHCRAPAARLADLDLRKCAAAMRGEAKLRQQQAQETRGAFQPLAEVDGSEHGAAEEFEGSGAQRLGKKREPFVAELADHRVVEGDVAADRDARPAIGEHIGAKARRLQQAGGIQPARAHAR